MSNIIIVEPLSVLPAPFQEGMALQYSSTFYIVQVMIPYQHRNSQHHGAALNSSCLGEQFVMQVPILPFACHLCVTLLKIQYNRYNEHNTHIP